MVAQNNIHLARSHDGFQTCGPEEFRSIKKWIIGHCQWGTSIKLTFPLSTSFCSPWSFVRVKLHYKVRVHAVQEISSGAFEAQHTSYA